MAIDESKLHELLSKMVADMGAAAAAPLVILGASWDCTKPSQPMDH
jgi:hypothetical protein